VIFEDLTTLLALFGIVAFGAIVPVVPTGAAVSAAAVVAGANHPVEVLMIVAAGAAGAYVGDIVTYAALRLAGESLATRVGWLHRDDPDGTLQRLRARIERHELRTLLLSRLVPGGRVPVLLAAALGGYPWVRFASTAIAAAALWSLVYTLIGVVGNSVLPDTLSALAVAVAAAMAVTIGLRLVQRRRVHAKE